MLAIWEDNGGAHDPYALMSVWTTREAAEAEIARLQQDDYYPRVYYLSPIKVDTPYNIGVEWEENLVPYGRR